MGVEYEANKLICCVQGDDNLYFIDRTKKGVTKMRTDKSVHFELFLIKVKGRTLVLLRDDFAIKCINPQTMKIQKVREAPFVASDHKKIYKTIDIVVQPDKGIDVFYLQSESDNMSTSVQHIYLSEAYLKTL